MRFFLSVFFIIFLHTDLFGSDCPEPFIPAPTEIFWDKIKPSPYTMVIKSDKYGDFNLTDDAQKSFNKYKDLCKKLDYSMEIPAAGLVNENKEIIDIVFPPEDKILLLTIDITKIYEINTENKNLLEELYNSSLRPDQADEVIEKTISNAIYHPLGKFCLGRKDKDLVILAEVSNQKIYIPLDCIAMPLCDLIQNNNVLKEMTDKKIKELVSKKIKTISANGFIESKEFSLKKDWYVISTPNACYWTDYFMNYIELKALNLKNKIPIHLHPWKQMEWLLETPEKYWISEFEFYLFPSGKDIEFFKSRYHDSKLYIILGKDPYSDELNWAVYDDIDTIEKDMVKMEIERVNKEQTKTILATIKKKRGIVQKYYPKIDKGLFVDEMIDELLRLNKRQISVLEEVKDYHHKRSWRLLNTDFLVPVLNKVLEKRGWKISVHKENNLGYDTEKKEFYYKKNVTPRMDLFLFILFRLCIIEENDVAAMLDKKAYILEVLRNTCLQLDYLCIQYGHLKEFADHVEYLSDSIRQNIWNSEKTVLIAKEQLKNGRQYLDMYNLGYYEGVSDDNLKLIAAANTPGIPQQVGTAIKDGEKPAKSLPGDTVSAVLVPTHVGTSVDPKDRTLTNAQCSKNADIINLESIVKELSKKYSIKNIEEFIMEFEKMLIKSILVESDL